MNAAPTPPQSAVQAILGPTPRALELLRLWEKQSDGSALEAEMLLAAAVLMAGQQVPSPAAALSAAQGLAGDPVWEGLVHLAQAWGALASFTGLSPIYGRLVADAVLATAVHLHAWATADGQPRSGTNI